MKGASFFFFAPWKKALGYCEIRELMETVLIKWIVASHSNKRIYGRSQQFSTYQLKIRSEANHTAAWELCREHWINQVLWTMKRCKKKKKKKETKRKRKACLLAELPVTEMVPRDPFNRSQQKKWPSLSKCWLGTFWGLLSSVSEKEISGKNVCLE